MMPVNTMPLGKVICSGEGVVAATVTGIKASNVAFLLTGVDRGLDLQRQ